MSAAEFGPAYWEDRYRGGQGAGWSAPSPVLVAEAADLPPGRALDAGCGRGADARWLAARGWRVTAVDVSATAVAAAAAEPGPPVEWVCADLAGWEPAGVFDLVTSQHVHVPGPAEDLFRRLASFVAPGGTLLVVGHAHGHAHAGAEIDAEQVTAVLPPDWEVVVAEVRTVVVPSGAAGEPLRHRRPGAAHGCRPGAGLSGLPLHTADQVVLPAPWRPVRRHHDVIGGRRGRPCGSGRAAGPAATRPEPPRPDRQRGEIGCVRSAARGRFHLHTADLGRPTR